jgi:hypothetical protein
LLNCRLGHKIGKHIIPSVLCLESLCVFRSVDDLQHFFKPLSLQFEKRFFFSRTFNIRPEDYLTISVRSSILCFLCNVTLSGIWSMPNTPFPVWSTPSCLSSDSFQDKGNVCLRVFDGTAIGFDSVIIIGGIQWSLFFDNFPLPNTFILKLSFPPISCRCFSSWKIDCLWQWWGSDRMDWFRLHWPKQTKQNSILPAKSVSQPTCVNIHRYDREIAWPRLLLRICNSASRFWYNRVKECNY